MSTCMVLLDSTSPIELKDLHAPLIGSQHLQLFKKFIFQRLEHVMKTTVFLIEVSGIRSFYYNPPQYSSWFTFQQSERFRNNNPHLSTLHKCVEMRQPSCIETHISQQCDLKHLPQAAHIRNIGQVCMEISSDYMGTVITGYMDGFIKWRAKYDVPFS